MQGKKPATHNCGIAASLLSVAGLRSSTLVKSITYFNIFTFTHQDVLVIWKARFMSRCKILALMTHCGVYCPLPVFPSCEILFCNYLTCCQVFVLPQSATSKQSHILHIARSLRCGGVWGFFNTHIYTHIVIGCHSN